MPQISIPPIQIMCSRQTTFSHPGQKQWKVQLISDIGKFPYSVGGARGEEEEEDYSWISRISEISASCFCSFQ